MVRRGGKICWQASSVIPAIPGYYEDNNFIAAVNFVPSQAPYTPAPIENYYIAANGFSGKIIRYIPATETTASCFWSNRWIVNPRIPGATTANIQINCFTDNASLNDIKMDVGVYSSSTPAGVFNAAPTFSPEITVPGIGSYNIVRLTTSFIIWGDNFQFYIRRKIDTNPGTIYATGILAYFQTKLY